MADTLTFNYGWTMPDPGGDANTWGNTLNATTKAIDAQVFTNAQAGLPVGSGALWFAATPPTNWLICDGSSLSTTGTYAALFAVLGTTYNQSGDTAGTFRLPNMVANMPIGAGAATINDVQTLSLSGGPTAGTFTLTYAGQTTAAIAWNALAANVQAALTALSSIGSGNVACTGGPLPGAAVTITFQGTLGNSARPIIAVGANNLTGGSAPQPNIVHTTIGSGANYALGAAGGAAAVALSAAMLPVHAHPITDKTHSHTVNQDYHDHSYSQSPHTHSDSGHTHPVANQNTVPAGPGGVAVAYTGAGNTGLGYANLTAQNANINFAGYTSAISLVGAYSGLSTTQNVGSGAGHQNLPPYLGVNFIIKYQ